jgi:hypothetical protein
VTWQTNVTLSVQIASDGGPFTDAPTWQTVTTDIMSVMCSRGRSERLATFSSGSATLKAKSLTRKYDPDYASRLTGLQLGRQVRVQATRSATTFDVFRGHLDSIRIPYTHRGDIAELSCVDMLAELGQIQLLDSAQAVTLRSFTPSVWWRLDETGIDASGGGNDATIRLGSNASYVDPLEVGGTGKAISGVFFAKNTRPLISTASSTWSVQFMVKTVGAAAASYLNMVTVSASGTSSSTVTTRIDSFGNLVATIGAASLTADRQVFDGAPHHILAVRDGTNAYLYVDGVLSASSASAGATTTAMYQLEAQSLYNLTDMQITIDEIALLGWAVDASSAAVLASGALTGWAGDTADARISRIATLLGIPAGRQNLETASSACGAFKGNTDTANYLQQIAAGENGRVFVSGDGKLTFQARTHDLAASVTAAFLDSSAGVRYLSLTNQQTRQKVITRASVSGVDVSGEYIDGTAETSYGTRSASLSTQLSSGAGCVSLATQIVTTNNAPLTRPGAWTASVGRTAGDIASLLALDIGTKATISRTPMGIAPAVSKTVAVEQVSHDIEPSKDWRITYTAAPTDTTALFRWGTSTWGGTDGWGYG